MTTVLHTAMYSDELLDELREMFPDIRFFRLPQSGKVPEDATDASVLLRCFMSKPELQMTLAGAPKLRWIHTCTAGFDQLLVPEIEARALLVTRSAATAHIPISEWVMACFLHMAKDFSLLLDAQREHQWAEPNPAELYGSTMGIVGAGAIGTEVARRAAGFGMRVIATQRTPTVSPLYDQILPASELDELLRTADYVVVACPLTSETSGMIGLEQFRIMKRTAYLVNIARGAVIVEAALIQALTQNLITGAAIDVFDQEPLPLNSPLWEVPNLFITPHSSFRSPTSPIRGLHEFAANLELFLAGRPLNNPLRDANLGY